MIYKFVILYFFDFVAHEVASLQISVCVIIVIKVFVQLCLSSEKGTLLLDQILTFNGLITVGHFGPQAV